MEDIPSVEVSGAYVGVCAMVGTVEPLAAPVAGWCTDLVGAWTRSLVDENVRSGNSSRWVQRWVMENAPAPVFRLRGDDGGVITVDTTGLDPKAWVPQTAKANFSTDFSSDWRIEERLLPVGARVYVLGPVQLAPNGQLVMTTQTLPATPPPQVNDLVALLGSERRARRTSRWSAWMAFPAVLATVFITNASYVRVDDGRVLVRWALVSAAASGALFAVAYTVRFWNRLREIRNRYQMAWSLIDVAVEYRHALIPNLVAIAQGAAHQERATLVDAVGGRTPFESEITTRLEQYHADMPARTQITMFAENNPRLAAGRAFQELFSALVETENRIAAARRFYDDAVTVAKDRSTTFPSSLLARTAIGTVPPLLDFETGAAAKRQ